MGMRIGAASTAAAGLNSSVSSWQQRQQSFNNLTSALQSGDLAGAQQAFSTLAGTSNVQGNSILGQLGQALKNGDLAGAQQAAQAIQNSRQAQAAASAGSSAATSAQTPSKPAGLGSIINTTA
ncbi:hypothetical protein [Paraburkholderia fungorum]|jgi:hypothetical protein